MKQSEITTRMMKSIEEGVAGLEIFRDLSLDCEILSDEEAELIDLMMERVSGFEAGYRAALNDLKQGGAEQ